MNKNDIAFSIKSYNDKDSNYVDITFKQLENMEIGTVIKVPLIYQSNKNMYNEIATIIYKDKYNIGVLIKRFITENYLYSNEEIVKETIKFIKISDKEFDYDIDERVGNPIAFTIDYYQYGYGWIRKPISYIQLKESKVGDIFRVQSANQIKDPNYFWEETAEIIFKNNDGCLIKFIITEIEKEDKSERVTFKWFSFIPKVLSVKE